MGRGRAVRTTRVDEEDAARADKESNSSFSVHGNDFMTGQLEDEIAEETIKSEDKFGLLSLGNIYRFDIPSGS